MKMNKPTAEEEIIPINKPKLQLITGGTGGDEIDWLSPLPVRTVFAARNKKEKYGERSFILHEWHVVWKGTRTIRLATRDLTSGSDKPIYLLVDPTLFCLQFSMVEILQDGDALTTAEASAIAAKAETTEKEI